MTRDGVAGRAIGVLAFGVAFGYVEAAVVVYLQGALGLAPQPVFPLHQATGPALRLLGIEVGREMSTLVMLAVIGWLAGVSRVERLAWAAVAFGAWDLAYYGWLWVFGGWPSSLGTWDVLFLVPVPWVGPVWAPMAVSLALVGVGLAAARQLGSGVALGLATWQGLAGLLGGALVVATFLVNAPLVLAGGVPRDYPWPLFVAGLALAIGAAGTVLAGSRPFREQEHAPRSDTIG